ncbi:FAD-dependent oxidoreductase [Streptomyces sp. NPDC001966]
MPHRNTHDVIVIGAGASGLAAATALHAAGHETLCLEARDRTGGRLLSAPTSHPERGLDLGATWFWNGEERVRALAAHHGTATRDRPDLRRLPDPRYGQTPASRVTNLSGKHT